MPRKPTPKEAAAQHSPGARGKRAAAAAAPRAKPPALAPTPDYGVGGKPWSPPKAKTDNPLKALVQSWKDARANPSTRLGRAVKFVRGSYTK